VDNFAPLWITLIIKLLGGNIATSSESVM
jgi:hypothetical protein